MRIEISYLKHFEFGVQQILPLHVDQDCLISELKAIINSHIKVPPKFQELYFQQYNKWELMVDDVNLGVYNIKQNQRIILKTPHFQADGYGEN